MRHLTTAEISKIVKANPDVIKWGLFSTYNDKKSDGKRRLKYMRNGWPVPKKMKTAIVSDLTKKFKGTNVESVQFRIGEAAMRGDYDYLEIIKID